MSKSIMQFEGRGPIYVYIMECGDTTYYIGKTSRLEQCLVSHFNGEIEDTAERLPVQILSYMVFNTESGAQSFQQFLNTHPGKKIIRSLVGK